MGIPLVHLAGKSDILCLLLSFASESLFGLIVSNKSLNSMLVKNELLWTALLNKLRDDCTLCWHEGKQFQQWVGYSARDELRMRISHRQIRKQWCVKFSSRALTCIDAEADISAFNCRIVFPQARSVEVKQKKPMYKLSRIVPLLAPSLGDDNEPTIAASERSMIALLDKFLSLEFPSLIIGGKRERKHFHCLLRGANMLNIKASGWYSEKIRMKTKYDGNSIEWQMAQNLSIAVGGRGNPSNIFWHSIVLRSYRSHAHYLLRQLDDDEGFPDYGPLRQLLVAVKLYRGTKDGKVTIFARVAGAIVLPCRLVCRRYSWIDRITDLEDDDESDR